MMTYAIVTFALLLVVILSAVFGFALGRYRQLQDDLSAISTAVAVNARVLEVLAQKKMEDAQAELKVVN